MGVGGGGGGGGAARPEGKAKAIASPAEAKATPTGRGWDRGPGSPRRRRRRGERRAAIAAAKARAKAKAKARARATADALAVAWPGAVAVSSKGAAVAVAGGDARWPVGPAAVAIAISIAIAIAVPVAIAVSGGAASLAAAAAAGSAEHRWDEAENCRGATREGRRDRRPWRERRRRVDGVGVVAVDGAVAIAAAPSASTPSARSVGLPSALPGVSIGGPSLRPVMTMMRDGVVVCVAGWVRKAVVVVVVAAAGAGGAVGEVEGAAVVDVVAVGSAVVVAVTFAVTFIVIAIIIAITVVIVVTITVIVTIAIPQQSRQLPRPPSNSPHGHRVSSRHAASARGDVGVLPPLGRPVCFGPLRLGGPRGDGRDVAPLCCLCLSVVEGREGLVGDHLTSQDHKAAGQLAADNVQQRELRGLGTDQRGARDPLLCQGLVVLRLLHDRLRLGEGRTADGVAVTSWLEVSVSVRHVGRGGVRVAGRPRCGAGRQGVVVMVGEVVAGEALLAGIGPPQPQPHPSSPRRGRGRPRHPPPRADGGVASAAAGWTTRAFVGTSPTTTATATATTRASGGPTIAAIAPPTPTTTATESGQEARRHSIGPSVGRHGHRLRRAGQALR